MITVPGFLLRKLYVRGTLQNTDRGIKFQLRNTLGAGYAEEMLPIRLDGREIPLQWCFFSADGDVRGFDQVSPEEPFPLLLNRETEVTVENLFLTQEPHTVSMGFRVPGLGALRFDFIDLPAPLDQPGAFE